MAEHTLKMSDQMAEGRTDTIEVPLADWVRQIVREASHEVARLLIANHVAECPARKPAILKAGNGRLEVSKTWALAIIAASGVLGVLIRELARWF